MDSQTSDRNAEHLEAGQVFPVAPEEMTHGSLVSFVVRSEALAVQVEGILVESTFIHDNKRHVHLSSKKEMLIFILESQKVPAGRSTHTRVMHFSLVLL